MAKVFKMLNFLMGKWKKEGGYRDILILAFPLILSTSAWSIQHFVDRMFLSWYSTETIAASMPAGMTNFAILTVFMGTASLVSTFVAQYHGAGQHRKIGAILWQGIYIAMAGGVFHLLLIPLAEPFFNFVGHEPAIRTNEIVYFTVLCTGAFPAIASSAFGGFFSGRGKPWPVMWISFLQTGINIFLDYCMIFGKLGFPEMGIRGAALATVISGHISFAVYFMLAARKKYEERFATLSGRRFNLKLFKRLVHFGLPNGIQFFVDMAGFAIFILFVGRLGKTPLAATNIAFNISSLAFMPMIGIGIAVGILVGQNLGKNNPDTAEKSVHSGFQLAFTYMSFVALLYLALPDIFIRPFAPRIHVENFGQVYSMAVILLRFVAFYSLFDTMNLVFMAALRGAGDTRYIMKVILFCSFAIYITPAFFAIVVLKLSIYAAWFIATSYFSILGITFLRRFLKGGWKHLRVIEPLNIIDNG
ncbi:MAG TPA: MATE family efflux transporter [bacterium]|nr:MATE family efflux transporter [bacterium]